MDAARGAPNLYFNSILAAHIPIQNQFNADFYVISDFVVVEERCGDFHQQPTYSLAISFDLLR